MLPEKSRTKRPALFHILMSGIFNFSYIKPDVKKTKSYYKQKDYVLKGNKAVQKNFERLRQLFFFKIKRYYGYALKEIYNHKDN